LCRRQEEGSFFAKEILSWFEKNISGWWSFYYQRGYLKYAPIKEMTKKELFHCKQEYITLKFKTFIA